MCLNVHVYGALLGNKKVVLRQELTTVKAGRETRGTGLRCNIESCRELA